MKGHSINRIAVLGAGVMGAQIAAHFANVGFKTYLFDLPAKDGPPHKGIQQSIASLAKLKPAPLADPSRAQSIIPATYETDLALLAQCDLIIEAIAERMDFKLALFEQIIPHIHDSAIIASNTSGLSIEALSDALPEACRSRFLGIHFFNPPRYMHLTEIIPSSKTSKTIIDEVETFLVSNLGKGVIRAKDTPNFIANRVGVFSMLSIMHHADRLDIPFDVVDAITGTRIGRPKSATFRTMDVVGLDTMSHVINTMADTLKDDPWHACFQIPAWLNGLIESGAIGQKARVGIYKKAGKEIQVFDIERGDYRPAVSDISPALKTILKNTNLTERYAALSESDDVQAQFLWSISCDILHYCAFHCTDIAESVRDIDEAMRWGFAWQLGPFELWQQSGWTGMIEKITHAIESGQTISQQPLPAWVHETDHVYDELLAFSPKQKRLTPRSELAVYQRQLSSRGETRYENDGVRLWSQEPDVAILSFKSPVNAISLSVIAGLKEAIQIAENEFSALVIWQEDADNFSLGANLKEFAPIFQTGDKAAIAQAVGDFQDAMMAMKYSRIPVVAGLRGRALGGGCELLLHCDHIVAALESYVGLVEIGVGLLPAGGGLKEFALRANGDLTQLTRHFKTIAMAEVASSAYDAREKGFLRDSDTIIPNQNEVLYVATLQAKALAQSVYRPPLPQTFKAGGDTVSATLRLLAVNMFEGQFISEHDYWIAREIAEVLSGGPVDVNSLVDEAWILKCERDAFAELAASGKTQARVEHLLSTGKPLRN